MIPPRKKMHDEGNVDSWLMSYADMITLLMCFFIIFLSVSEPKKDKFSIITKGIAEKFGALDLTTPFKGTMQGIQGIIERSEMLRDISVEGSDKGMEIEMSSEKFFVDRLVELKPATLPILTEIAGELKKASYIKYKIAVEGYTDDVPFSSPIFASNWEFSAARAARVVRLLLEQGVQPVQIKAVGYGDSAPKLPNLDSAGKPIPANRKINQRIVIRLERI